MTSAGEFWQSLPAGLTGPDASPCAPFGDQSMALRAEAASRQESRAVLRGGAAFHRHQGVVKQHFHIFISRY